MSAGNETKQAEKKKWFPLESNPDVMNKYMHNLGFPQDYSFHDVFGVDDELLQMVPQPALAVVMLFPITELTEKRKQEETKKIEQEGQTVPSDLYFMKQTVSNACGTMGIIHAAMNVADKVTLTPNGWFERFLNATKNMDPSARAAALESDTEIEQAHSSSAQEGSSQLQPIETEINLHFVAFVERDGNLFELDGRRPSPVNRGPCNSQDVLKQAVRIIKTEYMDIDPSQVQFNITALAPTQN